MFSDIDGLTFDELQAKVRASGGEDLRAAGEGWARAADLLDRQADTLAAGLPALERAWDSTAGWAHADRVRALVARMRATADVARYNYAQMTAAADATEDAIRQLALASESASASAERDAAARKVANALNETYANVAARLTEPLDLTSPFITGRPGPRVLVPGTDRVSLGGLTGAAVAPIPTAPNDPSPGDDTDSSSIDVEPDPPDVVESVSSPVRRSDRGRAGGQGERFPTTPRPAVAPVLPVAVASPPASASEPRSASSASGAVPAASRPAGDSKRAVEETYVDARGHHVRIRWHGPESVDPHP